MRYVCVPPAGMSTGTFWVPAGRFVAASVIWNVEVAETPRASPMLTPVAGNEPVLMIVTNAVAGWFTCTERLDGRTAATSGGTSGGRGAQPATSEYSKTWLFPALLLPACTQVPVWLIPMAVSGRPSRPTFR